MITKIMVEKEVDITHVEVTVPIRYADEDIPYDFPSRNGDIWNVTINVDNGRISNWDGTTKLTFETKICDTGTYTLVDTDGKTVATIYNDYVPNNLIPGEYGDYINLEIDEGGYITNWPKKPNFCDFFRNSDD